MAEVVSRVHDEIGSDRIGEQGDPLLLALPRSHMGIGEVEHRQRRDPPGRMSSSCRRTVKRNRSMHVPQTAAPTATAPAAETAARAVRAGVTDVRRSSWPGTAR
jgi:hypothetical protein